MPRLSLYRPEKGNDYKFIDKTIWEMFQVGGTDVFLHKYLGPMITPAWDSAKQYAVNDMISINNKVYKAIVTNTNTSPPNTGYWKFIRDGSASQPIYTEESISNIDDLLFLENRNRDYADDVYILRGVYSLQDLDFNLSQFGLFLQNDTVFMTFHINDTIEKFGRKLIAGDVIELPHLKDDHALNDAKYALKRFYVIEDITRAAEGFSVTWYPHLYRAKCKPMTASQEFEDILNNVLNADDPDSPTIGEINSSYEKDMQITASILDQAELDAPKSGYDITQFFTLTVDENNKPVLVTADTNEIDASVETQATDENGTPLVDGNGDPIYVGTTASTTLMTPTASGYDGYLVGDGIPTNGSPFTAGIAFPMGPVEGQFCLRKDYFPHRLFRFNGRRWVKVEDNVRMTMSNLGPSDVGVGDVYQGKDDRKTQKAGFINNNNQTTINGNTVKERQSLSKALRPEADE